MRFFTSIVDAFSTARQWARTHGYLSALIGLLVIAGGYYGYTILTTTTGETLYSLGQVSRSTIVSSISASGQVSASNQLDITADVAGDLTAVYVKPGQKVGAGALIARIDSADAYRTLRDAQTNLENAKLSLEKLLKPASGLTLVQAQNALASAQDSKVTAQENLQKAYTDSYGDIVSVFLDAPDMVTSLETILTGTEGGRSQWNMDFYENAMSQYNSNSLSYRNDAYKKFTAAKAAYASSYANYQKLGSTPTAAETDAMLAQTAPMLDTLADAVKSTDAFIRLYKTTMEGQGRSVSNSATNALATLGDLNTKGAVHVSAISGDVSTLKSATQSLASAERSITEKQQSLADVQDGPDELDVRSAQLTVQQRADAVADAQATLADYTVRAPFSGTIASVSAKTGQRASNGGAIATIVTERKIASLSLNEVDATKVTLGDTATLTFDAIEDLTLSGEVVEIDTLGAVTQGVVSYTVKVSFDSQDVRIKPGMTVNAAIQTDVKTDVLSVPVSAVKSQNGASYVLIFAPPLDTSAGSQNIASKTEPQRMTVETGITDDIIVEIVSGLTEGQQIVTKTTASGGAAGAATVRNGGIGGPGGGIRL